MAFHIVLMSIAAPAAALGLRSVEPVALRPLVRRLRRSLLGATLVQTALLWAWHAPGVLDSSAHSHHALMQASLLLAALWFWSAVLDAAGAHRWRAIFALLFTGKLFCLLGVLLVFAPRLLYPGLAGSHASGADGLADQQLAGLLMIAACPLTYVLAGTVIAARWLGEIDGRGRAAAPFPQTRPFAPE